MPMTVDCSMTRPCECGLRGPSRLFGFVDGTVGGAPSSGTVLEDPGAYGLPPTFTRLSLTLGRVREIQGGWVYSKRFVGDALAVPYARTATTAHHQAAPQAPPDPAPRTTPRRTSRLSMRAELHDDLLELAPSRQSGLRGGWGVILLVEVVGAV